MALKAIKKTKNYKMKLASLIIVSVLMYLTVSHTNGPSKKKYIYYLHGIIIEIQGKDAISEEYGKYEFDNIVAALSDSTHVVIAEVRTENIDYLKYANKLSKAIDSLVNLGVNSKDITVVGASKGAIIASNVSSINQNPINYVFLAGNNEYQETNNDWKFHGQVLCIYDLSDHIAGKNYDYWKNSENYTTKFEQLELKTGLGHGFLYKPLDVWIEPTKEWIASQRLK